jgi:hypothetical protein
MTLTMMDEYGCFDEEEDDDDNNDYDWLSEEENNSNNNIALSNASANSQPANPTTYNLPSNTAAPLTTNASQSSEVLLRKLTEIMEEIPDSKVRFILFNLLNAFLILILFYLILFYFRKQTKKKIPAAILPPKPRNSTKLFSSNLTFLPACTIWATLTKNSTV